MPTTARAEITAKKRILMIVLRGSLVSDVVWVSCLGCLSMRVVCDAIESRLEERFLPAIYTPRSSSFSSVFRPHDESFSLRAVAYYGRWPVFPSFLYLSRGNCGEVTIKMQSTCMYVPGPVILKVRSSDWADRVHDRISSTVTNSCSCRIIWDDWYQHLRDF